MADAPPPVTLTPIERRVYHYLIDFLAKHTYQPSVREIGRHFRIRSTKSVAEIIDALAEKGFVGRPHGRSRGVQLLGYSSLGRSQPVPQYNQVNSTDPVLTDENRQRFISMDRAFLPTDEVYLLRSPDDALAARGILRGDLLLINPSGRARDGDTLAVRHGDDLLVRLVERRGATLVLAGGQSDPEVTLGPNDDFRVLGTVAGVFRPFWDAEPTDGD